MERVVERAIRAYLKSNGITGPTPPPKSNAVIRVIDLVLHK